MTLGRRPWLAAQTIILFLLAAVASRLVVLQSSGLEALWPCNAIVLGLLIARAHDRRDIAVIAAAELVASILLHLALRDSPVVLLCFSCANVLESAGAYWLLRRVWRSGALLDRIGNIAALAMAAFGAVLFSAAIGAVGLTLSAGVSYGRVFGSWYVSGVLSEIMITPLAVVMLDLAAGERNRALDRRGLIEIVAILGLVAAITSWVFFMHYRPLTFVIGPFVLLATFRFRAAGAAAAVVVVAAIAMYATVNGSGPIATYMATPASRALMLQLFAGSIFLTALPVGVVLNERDAHAEQLRLMAEHFRSVVENIGEVIFRVDAKGRWTYLNPAWSLLSGKSIEASLGRSWLERFDPVERAALADTFDAMLRGAAVSVPKAVRFETQDGTRWIEIVMQALHDPEGRVAGVTGTLRDIDDRKRLEEHVVSARQRAEQRAREATLLAITDELTGIPNRRAFMARLDDAMTVADHGRPLAIAMFDIDHFKTVNDRYGHAVGDRVLQRTAVRAAAVIRAGDMIGRLGGEEFGLLMPGASRQEATSIAERLREAVEAASSTDEALPAVTVSVGIAALEEQESAAELLADADAALYRAKDDGRNRVRIAA